MSPTWRLRQNNIKRGTVLTAPTGDSNAAEDATGANAGLTCGAEAGCGWPGGGSAPGMTCTGAG